ncbi:MAG: phenylacetate--CoA ligase family protein [bacterium]|nr:phenylacetate--CoA ligase family protein [bacterium]
MNRQLANQIAHLVQRYRGWDYRADLAELEALETESSDAMHAYRMEKLRKLLEHCQKHVPFYRDAFAEAGFEPGTLKEEGDLRSLPIIGKDDLRADYSRFFASGSQRPFDEWATSGSSGEPFLFRLDRRSTTRNTFAGLARGRRWWDLDVGVPEVMIWSGVRDISDSLVGRFRALGRRASWSCKNILLVDTYDLDKKKVRAEYDRVLRFGPVSTRSISSGLYRFCELIDELGLDGTRLGIRKAIYTGEAFPESQKSLVERVLGCKAISEYGCTELGIIAFECPNGGLHLFHENMIFEYMKEGRPAERGEEAELVVTNLNDFVSPLVRYSVGDVVVPSNRHCSCGRTLPLIESVGGRTHASIRTPTGAVIHGLFFTHLFDNLPIVHRFRVVQPSLQELRLELTSTESIGGDVLQSLEDSVSKVMGEGVRVIAEQVTDLPLAKSGKFRWIVSEIDDTAS